MKQIIRRSASTFVVVWVFFALASVSQAGGKKSHLPPPKIPYTGIVSVNTTAMTITVEPKNSTATGTKTYKFTAQTKVTVNGQPSTVAGLTPGQQIHIGLGASDTVAEELKVTAPPADPEYIGHNK